MVDLTGGTVQEGSFPFDVWARTMRSVLANEPQAKLVGAQDPFGMPELRHALADYLRRERGLAADPSCIVVGAGSQILNMLLVQLLGADRRFAVEDPGYPRLTRLYEACGAQVRHVVLGDSGMSIVDLEAAQADVAHVMPSHQFPTGAVMPVGKRYELLGWASRGERRYLIEDEYDSEFRLAGRPIPTLASVDVAERVVYLNTFTKSLGPAFRVGYMVLPPHLALVLRERFGFYSCTVSAIEQLTLARFIEQGHFERHVNRMRVAYRRLRDALIASLEDALDDRVIVKSADSGLHFLLGLASGKTEKQIVSNLRAKGVEAKSLSSYFQDADLLRVYLAEDGQRWLVVSYSGLSEDEIPHVAEVFGSI